MSQISAAITVYCFFMSVSGSLLLWAVGLDLGDAIHHGFGAIATGGFSTLDASVEEFFRHSVFHVVSVITTSGFVVSDYTTWGTFPIVLMLFLTFIGACTGSTSGGVKVFRYHILYQLAREQLARLTHPNAVIVPRFNGREVSREVINSVAGFVFLYFSAL